MSWLGLVVMSLVTSSKLLCVKPGHRHVSHILIYRCMASVSTSSMAPLPLCEISSWRLTGDADGRLKDSHIVELNVKTGLWRCCVLHLMHELYYVVITRVTTSLKNLKSHKINDRPERSWGIDEKSVPGKHKKSILLFEKLLIFSISTKPVFD